ncbi:MAG TPA: hypothetical protein VMU12_02400 [Candidatus Paceibacterota bacterium]|nr:hypothetical protein [Candidatus Paceibacterota bacterium]
MRFLIRLWNTNPLWIVGTILGVEAIFYVAGTISADIAAIAPLVMVLAYVQNMTYGLQSRSANRNSNAYHAIAALAANFVFFLNRKLLVSKEVPIVLLSAYVFFTIMGTLHGNSISMKIEHMLGLSAEGAKGKPQLMKLWPTVACLSLVLAVQVALGSSIVSRGVLISLLVVTALGNFSFSLLRVARSTDHYWFHAGAVVLNLGLGFTELLIMIGNKFDWSLFLPTATGSIIGSLIGANLGQEVGKKLKAAFDAHVSGGVKVLWPGRQLAVLSLGLVVHLVVYWLSNWRGALALLAVSVIQAWSFTIVSRARQRNNQQYLAWASVFSNGIWYVCMHYLAQGKITLEKAAPYLVGNASGSLVGQNVAMKVEQATGALMEDMKPKTVAVPATA